MAAGNPIPVSSQHSLPVSLEGASSVTVKVVGGGTVYYSTLGAYVTPTSNQGSIANGASLTFTRQVFLRSGGSSSVTLAYAVPALVDASGAPISDVPVADGAGGYVWGTSGGSGGVPAGWIDVTQAPYSADKTGVSDCTTGVNNAIQTAQAAGGGVVYFPPGTYLVGSSTPVSLDQVQGVALLGAGPAMQYQNGPTILKFTAATGHLLTMNSATDCEVSNLQFHYTNSSFTGDLVTMDGAPHSADCQDNHIHHCSVKDLGGSKSARSGLFISQSVINYVDHCHFTGAKWGILLSEANPSGGAYVNVQVIEKCTFNFAGTAHIGIFTADGETITIRDCSFEGSYTAVYGSTAARDSWQNLLYNFVMENCWAGDASGSINWVDGLDAGNNTGIVRGCRFASTLGTHLTLRGNWVVLGNSFEGGAYIYDTTASQALTLVAIGNYYNNTGGAIFNPANFPGEGPPDGYVSLGNVGIGSIPGWHDMLGNEFVGVTGQSGTVGAAATDGDLIIGARSNAGYESPIASAQIYKAGSSGTPKLVLQPPSLSGNGQTVLVAGATPAPVVTVDAHSQLGFFNTGPVAQPSAAGTATGYAAGSTAVTFHSDDTYTGNVGTKAYTLNGIVAALKNLGLIASS